MRRRISLYIANQLVDLDDQSFILFNYTMEDMSNPAIVRNSFSQSITLKGTPNNNKIFGGIWRSDRETTSGNSTSGAYFDATRKTSFTIYNEMNEILESGYCKLENISRKKSMIEYKVSLYGDLGTFFYGLSYDDEGNKRTLADLKYTGSSAGEDELNFPITKDSVMSAWKRIDGDTSQSALWDIINFAPAYNGLPTGSFDADKAMVDVLNAGLSVPRGYSTTGGYVLASLPKEFTEWETKDLRSYLQRPVIKISKVIDAICQSYNNGGYEVELDPDFFSVDNPYYEKTYLALPILNTLSLISETNYGELEVADTTFLPPGIGGNLSIQYDVTLRFAPKLSLDASVAGDLYMHCEHVLSEGEESQAIYRANFIVYTANAYDAEGNLLQSRVAALGTSSEYVSGLNYVGYFTPWGEWVGDNVVFSFDAYGISYISISQEIRSVWGSLVEEWTPEEVPEPAPMLVWENADGATPVTVNSYDKQPGRSDYSYTTSESVRSGAVITKRNILSSEHTPADYLLSFCKMFGLVFRYERGLKKVSILQKENFYQDNVIDLTGRVDIGQDIEVKPYVFDSKWYNFGVKYENGEYAAYYANLYDRVFGLQRVNTGYGFNADSKEVMDSVIFNGAVEVLEKSKNFIDIMDEGYYIPSVFLDSGGTYTLFKNGEGEEFDLPTPSALAVKTWLNSDSKSYDLFSKVQFHDEDNSSYEERDTLLFFRGIKSLSSSRYALTDDNTLMMAMNNNTPCWILDDQVNNPSYRVTFLPMFSRYRWRGQNIIKSLDFGTPAEIDIPDVAFNENSSIYSQYWSRYIADRYDNDSKVMTCRVNLSGLQVDESLFQSFYYYDGALWALNKIINHSLTTWDDTECEFVKVQDKSNYIG